MKDKNAIGYTWKEIKKELFSREEVVEYDFRSALADELKRVRREKKISRTKLSEMSGVKPSIISSLEKGEIDINVGTVIKVLLPLGKKLEIVSLDYDDKKVFIEI